MSNFAEFSVNS